MGPKLTADEICAMLMGHLLFEKREGATLHSPERTHEDVEGVALAVGVPAEALMPYAKMYVRDLFYKCFPDKVVNAVPEKTDDDGKPNPDIPLGEAFASATKAERSNKPPDDVQD